MSYTYKYNKEYQTLQQFDEYGVLRSSMSMSQDDLGKLAQLYWNKILKDVDTKLKTVI